MLLREGNRYSLTLVPYLRLIHLHPVLVDLKVVSLERGRVRIKVGDQGLELLYFRVSNLKEVRL